MVNCYPIPVNPNELKFIHPNHLRLPLDFQESLSNSAWQFSRQNLRLLTVLGEGNFGRVSNKKQTMHKALLFT